MNQRNPWSPGVTSRIPWLPLAGFVLALVGLAASVAILVYSNGKPIADWEFQPPTYLAIATVITNICLFYVLKEGSNISWWHTATQATTVADLHRNYLFGTSFQDAILAGRHVNFVALTCIIATVAQINSPLLQRASTVVVEQLSTQVPIEIRLLSSVPYTYFTGYVSGRAYDVSLYSEDFSKVVQDFNNNGTIAAPYTGCKGTCSTTVEGLGFALNCSTYSLPFNLNPQLDSNGTIEVGPGTATVGIDVFESRFGWNLIAPSNFSLGVAYKSSVDCAGGLVVQNCSLYTAKVRYPVLVDGNASTIALDPHSDIFDDNVVEPYIFSGVGRQGANLLAGVWLALQNKYASSAHLRFTGAVGYTLTSSGNLATQYAVVNGSRSSAGNEAIGSSCDLYYSSPMTELLAGARNIMFRLSVAAANETIPLQTVTATQNQQRAVFRTNYGYMGGALLVTAVALLMSATLFHGFSSLGRSTTMSPIEIAKAFDAPILAGSDSNAKIKSLIDQTGNRSIMYGAAISPRDAVQVDYAEGIYGPGLGPDMAAKAPFVSSNDYQTPGSGTSRLHMGAAGTVRPPQIGEVFDE